MVSDGGMPPGGPETNGRVAELRELPVEPSDHFMVRLVHRIERRETTNHALWFVWTMPAALFVSIVDMAFGLFASHHDDEGDSQ